MYRNTTPAPILAINVLTSVPSSLVPLFSNCYKSTTNNDVLRISYEYMTNINNNITLYVIIYCHCNIRYSHIHHHDEGFIS